jgi:hypothetical protein
MSSSTTNMMYNTRRSCCEMQQQLLQEECPADRGQTHCYSLPSVIKLQEFADEGMACRYV